jgi:hypothetical protein
MALFICGLFTGMATMMAFAMWLGERERKCGVAKHRNPPPPPDKTEDYRRRIMAAYGINPELLSTYHRGTWFVGLTPEDMRFISHSDELLNRNLDKIALAQRIQDAVDREDFEEAARLQDLMKKQ